MMTGKDSFRVKLPSKVGVVNPADSTEQLSVEFLRTTCAQLMTCKSDHIKMEHQ